MQHLAALEGEEEFILKNNEISLKTKGYNFKLINECKGLKTNTPSGIL